MTRKRHLVETVVEGTLELVEHEVEWLVGDAKGEELGGEHALENVSFDDACYSR